jgi:uncharacterized Zn finger protein
MADARLIEASGKAGQDVSLTRLLGRYFAPNFQEQGRAYAQAGKVTNLCQSDTDKISAYVKGSERYAVELDLVRVSKEHAVFFGQCDCPNAESGSPCKHLWAMLLEAEQRSFGNRYSQITRAECGLAR